MTDTNLKPQPGDLERLAEIAFERGKRQRDAEVKALRTERDDLAAKVEKMSGAWVAAKTRFERDRKEFATVIGQIREWRTHSTGRDYALLDALLSAVPSYIFSEVEEEAPARVNKDAAE